MEKKRIHVSFLSKESRNDFRRGRRRRREKKRSEWTRKAIAIKCQWQMRCLIYCISRVVHQVERFPIGRNSYIRAVYVHCGDDGPSRPAGRKVRNVRSARRKRKIRKYTYIKLTSYTFHRICSTTNNKIEVYDACAPHTLWLGNKVRRAVYIVVEKETATSWKYQVYVI